MTNSILYNAGMMASNFDKAGRVYTRLDDAERRMRDGNRFFLESYHYVHKESYVKKMRNEGIKVFLDSGAFSAYTQGVKIDIGKYCDYCHKNRDIILFPSVLDVIDFNDKQASIKGTYRNQMEMERRFKLAGTQFGDTGFGPLPVAHYGEPFEVIQHYANNYSYMALGGLVPVSTPQMILWLDDVFEKIICDANGLPRVKVHGFGVTSLPVMQRYPWHSVDSSTWVMWSSNGMILMPDRGGQMNVSNRSASRKIKGQHVDNIRELEASAIEAEITRYGIDMERLRENYFSRWAFNGWSFPEYIQRRGFATKFVRDQPGLF